MSITDEQRQVRSAIIDRLRLDLLGPSSPDEVLVQNKKKREGDTPLTRYLIGILYPADTFVPPDEDDSANDGGEGEEDEAPEAPIQVTGSPRPSSIGLSFAVAEGVEEIEAQFSYGLYTPSTSLGFENGKEEQEELTIWARTQVSEIVRISLSGSAQSKKDLSGGGKGEWLCRNDGSFRVVSVFLRNTNLGTPGADKPEQCLYQPVITVRGTKPDDGPILNRSQLSSQSSYDPDLESYRLLYRDKPEFGVGHWCAVEWNTEDCPANRAKSIRTEILPSYELATTEARGGVGLPGLRMESLASAANGSEIKLALTPLADQYETWVNDRRSDLSSLPSSLTDKAREHLDDCAEALGRMREGIDLIARDPFVFAAFQFANRAMLLQRVKSVESANYQQGKGRIFDAGPPEWRPFQLAFILLNLKGIAIPGSRDREIADLLWFPTGGGKTEAYLGLSAFTMGLRRMRHMAHPNASGSGDGGVTVLMRYTLRLLTIQQFQRAATLLCACEVQRREKPTIWGHEKFSIGLWVGGGATPNYIDQKADEERGILGGALQVLQNFDPNNEPAEGNPVQLRFCPWCGESLSYTDYFVSKEHLHLQIRCPNEQCEFRGSAADRMSGIPALVVDEDIYLRCPTMLIGTVDKFARLPWDERTKSLFGRVDRRCARHGYLAEAVNYEGKCGGRHNAREGLPATELPEKVGPFLPPELIIQDELHLITGPLGSLMGLYENAVDFLCSQSGHRPKIIASTATIRRYRDQIRELFDREARQFPPPGLIASDSFFAAEDRQKPGRIYVGLCAPGKSLKTAAIRAVGSVMHTAHRQRLLHPEEAVDPYWTLVYYFNSLRELGGALRLIDDDIRQRLIYLAKLDNGGPARKPERRPELTSRIPAKEISNLLKKMGQTLQGGEALDVLLATNMISVGVDIQRFGLMLVTGQPKTSAEYIQATSRVGRQAPGLILTLYNWSRPRDLSHYERFRMYHSMLYRHVEASSVTPYSPRARDKALHAVFISLLRLLDPKMSGNDGAQNFNPENTLVRRIMDYLLERVEKNDPDELEDARVVMQAFVDGWVEMQERHGADFKFRPPAILRANMPVTWLMQAAEETETVGFPKSTLNSLREVEKTSGLYFKNFRRPGSARDKR